MSIDRATKYEYVQTNLDPDANDRLDSSYDVSKFEAKPAMLTTIRVGGGGRATGC